MLSLSGTGYASKGHVPIVSTFGTSTFPEAVAELREVEEASRSIGQKIVSMNASNEREIDAAFASIAQAGAGALVVMGGPFFTSKNQVVRLSSGEPELRQHHIDLDGRHRRTDRDNRGRASDGRPVHASRGIH